MKSSKHIRQLLYLFLSLQLALLQACSPSQKSLNPTSSANPSITATSVPIETSTGIAAILQIPESTPAQPADNISTTATPSIVTITVQNGKLSIRSGPDIAFDAVGELTDGESAVAIARSVLDGWVEILVPNQNGETGWISIKTTFGVVSGNVLNLPEIKTVEWPFGSYLRNCTQHQLIVEPGDTLLPIASSSSVDNHVWLYPGLYMIYDQDMSGQPWIMDVKLTQHISLDIRKDGTGQQVSCP